MSYKNGSCELSGGELWVNKEAVRYCDFTRLRSVCVHRVAVRDSRTQGSVIWLRVWPHTRLEDLRLISSSALHLSFEPMCVNNIESVMDFSSGRCRPTWAFQLSSLKTSMTLLDSWGLFGSLLSSPLLLGKEDEKDTKCIHSRPFIHSVNLPNPCKCKINRQKMMRHQFSSNTGVIKKTINIYRANESKEITKCVFSNALLMWCLLCIYKQANLPLPWNQGRMGWTWERSGNKYLQLDALSYVT